MERVRKFLQGLLGEGHETLRIIFEGYKILWKNLSEISPMICRSLLINVFIRIQLSEFLPRTPATQGTEGCCPPCPMLTVHHMGLKACLRCPANTSCPHILGSSIAVFLRFKFSVVYCAIAVLLLAFITAVCSK